MSHESVCGVAVAVAKDEALPPKLLFLAKKIYATCK